LDRCEIRVRVSFGAAAERNAGGQLREARNFPESLLSQNPENPDHLCKLGLCYVDLGQLDRGVELLNHFLQIAPGALTPVWSWA
jgi:tetratricopeptide (TPR) repeat protein